jgi:hypothetical protein
MVWNRRIEVNATHQTRANVTVLVGVQRKSDNNGARNLFTLRISDE